MQPIPSRFKGKKEFNNFYRKLYSTDASAYHETPLGVVFPEDKEDVKCLIEWAAKYHIPLIPRTAGTSLAGQVVGNGLVVDQSRTQNKILEINKEECWARVQTGVVRDELNLALKPMSLMFAPETSTSNRCMMGGMLGNNSCGGNSIVYGTTRDHIIEVTGFLSNGEEVTFGALSPKEFEDKCKLQNLEGNIYRYLGKLFNQSSVRELIYKEYPNRNINRRNTGYALDEIAQMQPFEPNSTTSLNVAKLIAGSEGTLFFATEIKLNLVTMLPQFQTALSVHVRSIEEAAWVNLELLKFKPLAVELIDDNIINLSKANALQAENAKVIFSPKDSQDKVKAVVVGVYYSDSNNELESIVNNIILCLKSKSLGTNYIIAKQQDVDKIWEFRKAGLGTLANMPGDEKPVPVIEDSAIHVNDYPAFLKEFGNMMEELNTSCVYYAHIGAGCMHIRPVINLKTLEGRKLFHTIAQSMSRLVKKYNGSLSSEHGDGRLRGEFIPYMVGDKIYQYMIDLKKTWDPSNIFNPGKIVMSKPMIENLRGESNVTQNIDTYFDWTDVTSFQHAVEKCNGSGDCRKNQLIGGAMCPSYMVTRDEKDSTRGRANILREFFVHSEQKNPLDYKEIKEVMELCLSCKACKRECPSNVDMTKLKAEFLQHYYENHFIPISDRSVAYIARIQKIGRIMPFMFNLGLKTFAPLLGFSNKRSMPGIANKTFYKLYKNHKNKILNKCVILIMDEFTNYTEPDLGLKTVFLLEQLGYEVIIPHIEESARTYLSKGLVKTAKKIATKNISKVIPLLEKSIDIIGVEPSSILGWRDEYPNLVPLDQKQHALEIAKKVKTIEEFLFQEIDKKNISKDSFTKESANIHFHVHCHQRALSSPHFTQVVLSFPENYQATEIKSGCCGMAGSFGYYKKHYEMSLSIGEMKLFPAIRGLSSKDQVAASGTSCRHQIYDGTNRNSLHPVEILYNALLK